MRGGLWMLAVAVGCAPSAEIEVLPGSGSLGEHKIINGFAPDSVEHEATVSLHQTTNGGASVYVSPFCSGTLIAENVVLTAAHCLDSSSTRRRWRAVAPSEVAVYVGDDPADQSSGSYDLGYHLYAVTDVEINSGYDKRSSDSDIALLTLGAPVTEAAPVPNLPTTEGLSSSDTGATVNFAGFGQDENGNSGVKLQVDGTIGGLGCAVSGCPTAGNVATMVSYSQPTSTGGPCFGDSGGPMFVYRSSGTYVGGVTSYGDSTCSVYGVSTRVDAFASWIDAYVAAASGSTDGSGGTATDGTATDGTATDGTGGTDTCGDTVCDVGESCDGRSGTTACPTDCDGVTTGRPSNRYCYVDGACEGAGCP